MRKNILWMVVSCLIALSLMMAACAPAATPTAPAAPTTPAPSATPSAPTTPTTPVPEKPQQQPVSSDKPKYGGTVNILQVADITSFDPAVNSGLATVTYTNDFLVQADWAKGPAGTGANEMLYSAGLIEQFTGAVAESWEIPGIGTFIFKIRRGVRYALDPASEASRLMNGRELTAEDVVFSVKRMVASPISYFNIFEPAMSKNLTIEKTGPWEVTIKTPVDPWWAYITFIGGFGQFLQAPEVVQKYGSLADWRNSVGTGAYTLKDFVPGSAATLARNPNYWDKNPIGPGKGDQLPYLDAVRLLIIIDPSTRLAALRTAKIDWASAIGPDDARSLKLTTPDLKSLNYKGGAESTLVFAMRTDKTELPFKDKRVRQALMMATDYQTIKTSLFRGEADVLAWPFVQHKAVDAAFIPLEQLPEPAQTLYKYNPTKAKQLLAEAGYPNGFKTKVIVQNLSATVDLVSVIKDQWSKVGVDLEIQPKETGNYNTLANARSFDEMIFRQSYGGLVNMGTWQNFRGTGAANGSYVDDPTVEAAFQEVMKNVIIDMPKVFQIYRGLLPYLLEQAYVIPTPWPYISTFWWPWLKDYHGETAVRVSGLAWKYVWIDQALKASMGH